MNTPFKRRCFNPWICSFAGLLLSVAAIAYFYLHTLESHLREIARNNLEVVNQSCVLAVETWRDDVKLRARYLAREPQTVALAHRLIAQSGAVQEAQPELSAARDGESAATQLDFDGEISDVTHCLIVDRAGAILSSAAPGARIEWNEPDHFAVFQLKRPVVSPPPSKNDPGNATVARGLEDAQAQICAAAPILGENGDPVAALVLTIDPTRRFFRYFESGRNGKTGETYAFDERGMPLTPSRFDVRTKQGNASGAAGRSSVTGLTQNSELPSALQPSNRAAVAMGQLQGTNVDGYTDYRGAEVLGSWTWLADAGYGIATEIDATEAYHSLVAYRNWMMWATVFSVVTFIGNLLVVYKRHRIRRRNNCVDESSQLGQYVLKRVIGKGGMGTVYLADHEFLNRQTALKLIRQKDIDAVTLARFQREVKMASKLKHPNTVRIFDYGIPEKDVFYYSMEFIEGITLADLVEKFGPLPDGRVIMILKQMCNALLEAHGIGLVHRDVKPSNVILSQQSGLSDFVKLLDFGLVKDFSDVDVKLTRHDIIAGTPEYISPEAIEAPDEIDHRADIYAIGAVGYFLLTGRPVFQGKSPLEIAMKRIHELPVPPSRFCDRKIDPMLESLIMDCLARNPDDRPQYADILKMRLDTCPTSREWSFEDAEAWWKEHPQCRIPDMIEDGSPSSNPNDETVIAAHTTGDDSGEPDERPHLVEQPKVRKVRVANATRHVVAKSDPNRN